MGCSMPLILFVAAFEIILSGTRQIVGGIRMTSGQKLKGSLSSKRTSYSCSYNQ